MNIALARLFLVIVAYILAYYLAAFFGNIYAFLLPNVVSGSGFFLYSSFAEQWLAGLPLALMFFVAFGQRVLGPGRVWWWIGTASLPAILFNLAIDPLHIYLPIVLSFIGWGLGVLLNKALHKLVPSFMARIS